MQFTFDYFVEQLLHWGGEGGGLNVQRNIGVVLLYLMKDLLQEIDKQGVCHTAALPFTLESKYLKAKEELWKLKYFTMQR